MSEYGSDNFVVRDDDWSDVPVDASAAHWGLGVVAALGLILYGVVHVINGTADVALDGMAIGTGLLLHSRYWVDGMMGRKFAGRITATVAGVILIAAVAWMFVG